MTEQQKIAAVAGDLVTVTGAISMALTPEGGRTYVRGTVLEVTEEWIESSRNRLGESYLDDLSPEAQVARWGAVKFVLGDQSESVQWWNGGDDASLDYARQIEKERIAAISDPVDRFEAAQAAKEKFGTKPSSRVVATYAPDAEGVYSPQDMRGVRR